MATPRPITEPRVRVVRLLDRARAVRPSASPQPPARDERSQPVPRLEMRGQGQWRRRRPGPIPPEELLRVYELIPKLTGQDLRAAAKVAGFTLLKSRPSRRNPGGITVGYTDGDLFDLNEALGDWVRAILSRRQIAAVGRRKLTASMRAMAKRIHGERLDKRGKRRVFAGERPRDVELDRVLSVLLRICWASTGDGPRMTYFPVEREFKSVALDWIEAVIRCFRGKLPDRLMHLLDAPPSRTALASRLQRLTDWKKRRRLEELLKLQRLPTWEELRSL